MADDTPTVEQARAEMITAEQALIALVRRATMPEWHEDISKAFDAYGRAQTSMITAVRAERERRCEGRYDVPMPRSEPFPVTYRCGLVAGHDGPHQSDDGDTLWKG